MSPTRWLPLLLSGIVILLVLATTSFTSRGVESALRWGRQGRAFTEEVAPASPLPVENPAGGGDTGGPLLNLERPTERDWRFLEDVLVNGTGPGRLSAARALVLIGDMRGAAMLLGAAAWQGEEGDALCVAALEIMRHHKAEDVLPLMLRTLAGELGEGLDQDCRTEVADRFRLAGGRDPQTVATMVDDPDPTVRAFVASFLAEVDPGGHRSVLERLAEDPHQEVRERAGSVPSPGDTPTPTQEPQ